VLEALQTGGTYINVHTPTNGPGEIRGQIGVTANVTTALNARQEVPKPKGNANRARGKFTATVTKASATTGSIAWRLTFSKLTGRAVAAHIHIGAAGRSGPVAVPLCGPCRSGVRRTATLQSSVLAALEAGRAYVNIHTPRNPAGEIRGQIRAVPLSIS
jgi:CHRD domain